VRFDDSVGKIEVICPDVGFESESVGGVGDGVGGATQLSALTHSVLFFDSDANIDPNSTLPPPPTAGGTAGMGIGMGMSAEQQQQQQEQQRAALVRMLGSVPFGRSCRRYTLWGAMGAVEGNGSIGDSRDNGSIGGTGDNGDNGVSGDSRDLVGFILQERGALQGVRRGPTATASETTTTTASTTTTMHATADASASASASSGASAGAGAGWVAISYFQIPGEDDCFPLPVTTSPGTSAGMGMGMGMGMGAGMGAGMGMGVGAVLPGALSNEAQAAELVSALRKRDFHLAGAWLLSAQLGLCAAGSLQEALRGYFLQQFEALGSDALACMLQQVLGVACALPGALMCGADFLKHTLTAGSAGLGCGLRVLVQCLEAVGAAARLQSRGVQAALWEVALAAHTHTHTHSTYSTHSTYGTNSGGVGAQGVQGVQGEGWVQLLVGAGLAHAAAFPVLAEAAQAWRTGALVQMENRGGGAGVEAGVGGVVVEAVSAGAEATGAGAGAGGGTDVQLAQTSILLSPTVSTSSSSSSSSAPSAPASSLALGASTTSSARKSFVLQLLAKDFHYTDGGQTRPSLSSPEAVKLQRALDLLSASLYSSEVHFVMELLQNCDDNQVRYTYLCISLTNMYIHQHANTLLTLPAPLPPLPPHTHTQLSVRASGAAYHQAAAVPTRSSGLQQRGRGWCLCICVTMLLCTCVHHATALTTL
jgi:hypothetical protein